VKASVVEKKIKSVKASTEKAEEKNEATPAVKVAEPKSEKVSARTISESAIDYRAQSKAKADPKKQIFLLMAIAAGLIFAAVNLRPLFFSEPVKEEVVIIQEVSPQPAPAAEAAADVKSAPAPAPVAEPVAAAATVSTECPQADPAPLNYKPDAPKKAGDMVYLQSKTTQTVCVVDASGKTQNKTLEPGVGASVYGKPPLKVLTGGLNQVDMYFQGAKVRIGNTNSKTINLEPAEIIQPAAQSTSTDSQLR
jgi:hypothetical protein